MLLMAEKRSKLRKVASIVSGLLTAETHTSRPTAEKLVKPATKLVINYVFMTVERIEGTMPELLS